ncbi:putative glutathione S-transferase [Curcuma longa]|uniref:putative glutathione S-transferase n=1 Tax=Curcuma longa TaxID=136217 RepID=UPI003D9DD489
MAEAEQVKVLRSWLSPWSFKVELALKLKGVPHEKVEEDLANKSPLLLASNPIHKKIPVLLHNGKAIPESGIILEYIDETWTNNPILPKAPYERSMARFWSRFIDDKCVGACWMSCWTEGETQQMFMEQARASLRILDDELGERKFFGGESIGLVDISACFLSLWFGVLQEVAGISLINGEEFPNLCRWIEGFVATDAVTECLPPRDELLATFQSKKQAILATKSMVY